MATEVRPVRTRRDRRTFRDLPRRLLGDREPFVPMLDAQLATLLDRKRNPFWKHAEGREWLAFRGRKAIGRIGACRDRRLEIRAPGCGVVGLFDCADDEEAAAALFGTAFRWLRERGLERARGPLNYSIHDTAGLLVDGFETPPYVDTTWNPAYYETLWDAAGWKGVQDLLGCFGEQVYGGDPRVHRFAERALRKGVSVRPIDVGRFDEEMAALHHVYNGAWDENWGHVPLDREEFLFKAKDMKPVFDPDLVRLAEADGEPVGVYFGLPDLNVPIRRSGGRLLPLGWLRLLRAKRTVDRVRVVLLGVVPGWRRRGVEAALLADSYEALGRRYRWVEASWVLADNMAMLNAVKLYGLAPYKRWRLYETGL